MTHSYQDELLWTAPLGNPPTNNKAIQADETRAPRKRAAKAVGGARSKGGESRADPQAHRMEELKEWYITA
jgi:hypothetical protein